jgi:hypothetical protein
MNALGKRVLLRLRLLRLALAVGACSSILAVGIVALWVAGFPVLAVVAVVAWLVATTPWILFSTAVAVDLLFLLVARGAVVVPTMVRVAKSLAREREITKRPAPPLGLISKAAFYTNPLMPLTIATATFLESRPALEPAVSSLHDAIMQGPRRRPMVRLTVDWNGHRLRDAAA